MELTNQFVNSDTNETAAIVMKLVETLLGCGHTVDGHKVILEHHVVYTNFYVYYYHLYTNKFLHVLYVIQHDMFQAYMPIFRSSFIHFHIPLLCCIYWVMFFPE
jgi:hypothetical protein